MTTPTPRVDVCVIGAGVVGCAIARRLARTELSVLLLDAADDVGAGTSKANTAILHTGQSMRIRRWLIMPRKVLPVRNGSTPISVSVCR